MWGQAGQLRAVSAGQAFQHRPSRWCQPDDSVTPVARLALPNGEASFFQPVDEPHGAMMANQQVGGQHADRRPFRRLKPANRQHHLMLLRFQALAAGCLFTEVQKSADVIAEVGEGAIFLTL